MKRKAIGLACVIFLLLASNALAMTSTNYRLDWFVPITGSAGSSSSSANYAARFTVGQTAIGAASSPNYDAGFGYWYGIDALRQIFLPLIRR